MISARLYILQRLSALIMAPLVIGHIGVMIYAVQDGLSAAEILGRTQGSVLWAGFYGLFVIAVSIHAAIGIRAISSEWFKLKTYLLEGVSWAVFAILLSLGFYAILGVII